MSKVDYAKIREENIKNYGTKTHHLAYFADIYSTRTHFIFEVLQNAEDALARRLLSSPPGYVRFHLYFDRLEIYHNGKPFDDRDIVGICGIGEGTKAGDYTQIGKFGIGFKSVYAYSFFPQIHSEDEHFEIRRFVEPYEIAAKSSEDTLILLPFDQPDKRPEWAFRKNVNTDVAQSEISRAITKLNFRTLLFLGNVEKIEWILASGEQGFLTTENKLENKQNNWRIVEVSDHQGKREQWHIFARTITVIDEDKEEQVTVEVAFLMDKNGEVIKASDTELVVSFPTEKKTELGFLIQAPFKATKSRDNIKRDDPANHKMIQTAAQLTADSLSVLRDTNRLAVTSYSALPLDEDDFPEDNFFRPVYDRVREALKTQSLLPAHCGGFIKADEAKLARGKDLVDLFSSEQLGKLFDKEKLAWLDASITIDSFADFHGYLLDLVDGIQVTPDSLVPKLTDDFLSNQSVAWLIQLIQYAEQGTKALRRLPFIRLESGEQVALHHENENPSAWFAPKNSTESNLTVFPLVHHKLAENEEVRKFLEKEGIPEINSVDIVELAILPKYKDAPFDFDTPFSEYEKAYRADLHQLGKAYADADDEIKGRLNESLIEIEWLACIYANGNEPEKVFWKTPESANLYAKSAEKLGFTLPEDKAAYFLHQVVSEVLGEFKSINDYLNESIQPIAPLTIVNDFILPKYKTPSNFDEACYRNDLQWICKAFSGDDSVKNKLKLSLSSSVIWHPHPTWLACVHASGKEPEIISWKKPNAEDLFAKPVDEQMFHVPEKMFHVPENMDGYFLHPSVVDEFSKNESAKAYLEKCVTEMNAIAIVEKFILPKYTNQGTSANFDEVSYRADLQWIGKAYSSNKYPVIEKLKNTTWLACIHASGNHPDDIVWEREDSTRLYKSTSTHLLWFSEVEDVNVYFLHPIIKDEFNGICGDLISSIGYSELVQKQTPNYQNYVEISKQYGYHKRGLDGFDPNWEITGINQILTKPSLEQSKILWTILLKNIECIRGFTEKSNRSTYENIKKIEEFSRIGYLLSTSKWLQDKAGILHKPSELLLTDLPDEFDTRSAFAIEVADKLGMKKPEVEQAINIIAGGDSDFKRLIEIFQSASNADKQRILKMLPQEIPPQPAPFFKDGFNRMNRPQRGSISASNTDGSSYPLDDPKRYQRKADKAVEENVKLHQTTPQTIRFLPVRDSPSNKHARDFLYEQYQGKCQITGDTFPKASANTNGDAEYYFEASSLLSYSNADYLNDAGNMICVSADTLAKLKNASFEWLDDMEPIIERFKNREIEIENVNAKVQLAGEECEITWSERHFMCLVALWDKAS